MSSPFLGEVRPWGCTFSPRGWASCAGQTLPISQNTALFALIGTYYGGNGTSTFQLPDLRSRVPMKYGTSPSGTYVIGETGGEEQITLTSQQMPVHTHTFFGVGRLVGNQVPVDGDALGTATLAGPTTGDAFYAADSGTLTNINIGTVSLYPGGNQAHTNIQPYQAINWCIALAGIFPARN
jgi:microcystin-dependent protein